MKKMPDFDIVYHFLATFISRYDMDRVVLCKSPVQVIKLPRTLNRNISETSFCL